MAIFRPDLQIEPGTIVKRNGKFLCSGETAPLFHIIAPIGGKCLVILKEQIRYCPNRRAASMDNSRWASVVKLHACQGCPVCVVCILVVDRRKVLIEVTNRVQRNRVNRRNSE